jgi:hypothetical protein
MDHQSTAPELDAFDGENLCEPARENCDGAQVESMTPMEAMRAKCLDCCVGKPSEVRLCVSKTCALHPFRLGHNPHRAKRVFSGEKLEALQERLAIARQVKADRNAMARQDAAD